jgi:hypothetical protein
VRRGGERGGGRERGERKEERPGGVGVRERDAFRSVTFSSLSFA